jgi:hypothetical protein
VKYDGNYKQEMFHSFPHENREREHNIVYS